MVSDREEEEGPALKALIEAMQHLARARERARASRYPAVREAVQRYKSSQGLPAVRPLPSR
jgi:hypothetical protein